MHSFCNPDVIKDMNDVKLGSIPVASDKITYLELIDGVRDRILGLISDEIDTITKNSEKTREDAVADISRRVYLMLGFFERNQPSNEEELADEIMRSKEFDLWQMRVWGSIKDIHTGQMTKDTPIPSQGVLNIDESAVNDALEELTLEGYLEVLKNYPQ